MHTLLLLGIVVLFVVIPGLKAGLFLTKEMAREQELKKLRAARRAAIDAEMRKQHVERLIREQQEREEQMLRMQESLRRILNAQQKRQPPARRKGVVTRGDVRRARELLIRYGGYKVAVKKTHPDNGGNASEFDAVMQAKKLVDRFPHVT